MASQRQPAGSGHWTESLSFMVKPLSKRFPVWQSVLILIFLPGLYILKDRIGLIDLLSENLPQIFLACSYSPRFIPFWSIVLLLHFMSVFLVMQLLKFNGLRLEDIGFKSTKKKFTISFGILFLIGIIFVVFRTYAPIGDIFTPLGKNLAALYTINLFQRCCWVIISLSAGFCEELVYRGFGLAALADTGMPTWAAVLITSISFAFIHGIGPPVQMIIFIGAGVLFAMIYLISKNLLPVMVFHAGYDLLAIIVQ